MEPSTSYVLKELPYIVDDRLPVDVIFDYLAGDSDSGYLSEPFRRARALPPVDELRRCPVTRFGEEYGDWLVPGRPYND